MRPKPLTQTPDAGPGKGGAAAADVLPLSKVRTGPAVDKYTIPTSCPFGLEAFNFVDSYLLADKPLVWSDYVAVHGALLGIVRKARSFVFHISAYTSPEEVRQ